MRILIVSTYPENGSRNIGDALITQCTREALSDVCRERLDVNDVFRADEWKNVREKVEYSDFIVFACLAIRPAMENKEYPYLSDILQSGVPYGVLAAGTALIVDQVKTAKDVLPQETQRVLKRINEEALFFTTRGVLTQWFCEQNGLDKAKFAGDIAFYGNEFASRKFRRLKKIKRIAISDPHQGRDYLPVFEYLIRQANITFPESKIEVFLHGKNQAISEWAARHPEITARNLYEDKESGLDAYNGIDLHLGFRVHGHVSALKRRKPSYLLEQDGRGLDYGLTINSRVSVPCFGERKLDLSARTVGRSILRSSRQHLFRRRVSRVAVDQLFSMVCHDRDRRFGKFDGMEAQIEDFIIENKEALSLIGSAQVTKKKR